MSILDLKDIAKKRIPSHGSHEILFGSLVSSDLLHLVR